MSKEIEWKIYWLKIAVLWRCLWNGGDKYFHKHPRGLAFTRKHSLGYQK